MNEVDLISAVRSSGYVTWGQAHEIVESILTLLAAPSAPAEQAAPDQRTRFEAAHCGGNKHTCRRNEHGDYVLPSVQDAWAGWQSCSSQAAPVTVPNLDLLKRVTDVAAMLYSAWENGLPCYEDPDDCTGYLGNAFMLDDGADDQCVRVINEAEAALAAPAAPTIAIDAALSAQKENGNG